MGKRRSEKQLQRPCEICGMVDRYPTSGRCRPCHNAYMRARWADPSFRRPRRSKPPNGPCSVCGATDRFPAGGCRPCATAKGLARSLSKWPCKIDGTTERGVSGNCLACAKRYAERVRSTPEGRERLKGYQKAYNNKPEVKALQTKRYRKCVFGIGLEEQDLLMESQGGRCACCGDVLLPGKKTHLDHDHTTGRIRGFLCHLCNMTAGHLKDDPIRALKMAAYLAKHAGRLEVLAVCIRALAEAEKAEAPGK